MKKIGVLGTGTMGAGIIQVLAQHGYEVVMRARRESSVEKGLATVKKNLDKMVAKEKITAEEAYRLAKDGPRYKAIGNSMAVPVMRWIGKRIKEALDA